MSVIVCSRFAGLLAMTLVSAPTLAESPAGARAALRLAPDGPVVGVLLATPPAEWVLEGGARLRLPVSAPRSGALEVVSDAAAADPFASQKPRRVVSGHWSALETDSGVPFASFECDALEVLEERGGRARVRLTDPQRRFQLIGWVPGPLAARGSAECPPRAVLENGETTRGVRVVLDAEGRASATRGFVPAAPEESVRVRYEGDVYWPQPATPGSRRECQRWTFGPIDGGVSLQRQVRTSIEGGLWEEHASMNFEGNPPTSHYAISRTGRWLREPKALVGFPGSPGAIAGLWPFQVVNVTPGRIEWLEARGVVAYHPDDVEVWYRSKGACEASLRRDRRNPRR